MAGNAFALRVSGHASFHARDSMFRHSIVVNRYRTAPAMTGTMTNRSVGAKLLFSDISNLAAAVYPLFLFAGAQKTSIFPRSQNP